MRKIIPALLLVAVAVVGVMAFSGDDEKYVVFVKAKDAGGVLKNYNVKIGEVAAGKIVDISLDDQDNAVLKMELDKGAYPIGTGATAAIRPVNLLGEKYVDLSPGDLTKPVESGVTIQPDKTSNPIELDDALNILDPDTRGAMRILINEAGLAMAGRGADFNQTLNDLPPAVDAARRVVKEVDDENLKLKALITQGDRVLATVTPKRDDLGDLVESASDALETAAQRRENLGRTVQGASGALSQLRGTLIRLQDASAELAPAADDLRATAPKLDDTLEKLPQFTKDAKSTFAELRRVSPALSRLGRRSTPTLRLLRPTVNRLAAFTGSSDKFIDTLDTGGATDFFGFVNGWASLTGQKDQLGHVFRLSPHIDRTFYESLIERNVNLPAAKAKAKSAPKAKKPAAAATPAPVAKPSVKVPALPTGPVTDQLNKTVKDVTDAVNGLLDGQKGTAPAKPSGGTDAGKILNYLLGP